MFAPHPAHTSAAPTWSIARDVLSGERAVKAAAERYLPRLDSQTDDDYRTYVARASFLGAASQVLDDCLAAVFRKAPVVTHEPTLAPFVADLDQAGTTLQAYARQVLAELLAVGRAASLVLWSAPPERPVVRLYRAEDLLDWQAGAAGLDSVTLRDSADQVRRLRLFRGRCLQEIWTRRQDRRGRSTWWLQSRQTLKRGDDPLAVVPCVIHSTRPGVEIARAPLADIIAANLDHYRLSADYRHGLHLASLPTAWVCGFDKNTALRVGSTVAWLSEDPGATAGFLEFKGLGLARVERALADVERHIENLGARLLGRPSGSAGPDAARTAGTPGLLGCIENTSATLSRVLAFAHAWACGTEFFTRPAPASITLNTQLDPTPLAGSDLTAAVDAWRAGAISRDTLLELLRRGDLLPVHRTTEDEKRRLHRAACASVA